MKKKIIILGSTGSVGSTTFNIFKKDKKNFDVILLSTDSNVKKIMESNINSNLDMLEKYTDDVEKSKLKKNTIDGGMVM